MTMTLKKRAYYIILFFVFAIAIFMRLYPILFQLPDVYSHDEQNYIETALRFGSGNFMPYEFSHGGFFYFVLFLGFGAYYLIGLISGIFHSPVGFYMAYLKNPWVFFMIGRCIVAASSLLTLGIIYRTALFLFSKPVALTALIFAAFSLLSVQLSFIAHADIFSTMLLTISFYTGLKALFGKKRQFIYISSFLLGLATATKYNAVFGISYIVLFEVYSLGFSVKNIYKLIRNMSLSCFFVFLGFIIGAPFIAIKPFAVYHDSILMMAKDLLCGPAYRFPILFHIKYHLRNAFGLPLEALFIMALFFSFIKRERKYIFLAVFPVAFYTVVSRSIGFCHHLLPLVPFVAILSAKFLYDTLASIKLKYFLPVYFILSFFIISPILLDSVKYILIVPKQDTRAVSRDWIEKNLPADSVIIEEGAVTEDMILGPQIRQNKFSLERDIKNIKRKGGSGKTYDIMLKNNEEIYKGRPFDVYKVSWISAYDKVKKINPEYIITSGFYDLDIGEFNYRREKDFMEKRLGMAKNIAKDYKLIKAFYPTRNFSFNFPSCMMNCDYMLLRSLSFGQISNFINGPVVKIYERK